ncbi:GntR family transcriptional regulator [Ensifer sp. LC163]|uniref:GntR family transcriptional regulator n=1 Tax=Ensifer sp. LC163 TaxID=1120652 RepID=UPI0008137E72|nr:GntR family transcriptional regulator [Ensifer sp. LC163]OCP35180.1 GntR family transcriptional regulator [Ensifer sp. LC163]
MTAVAKGLKHKTMASAAAEEIRNRIVSGDYPPGSQLRQDGLAEDLGMSRIPIREALVQLESEGLLKILPHRGAIVVQLTADEIEELFNMRLLLEPFLFKRSAPLLTRDDLNALHQIQTRYANSIDKLDMDAWNELNTEFHLCLYRHARSPRIVLTVQTLLAECDRHTRIQLSTIHGDREKAVREHAELLRLCEQGAFEEGARLMYEHIDHIRGGLVALLGCNVVSELNTDI